METGSLRAVVGTFRRWRLSQQQVDGSTGIASSRKEIQDSEDEDEDGEP